MGDTIRFKAVVDENKRKVDDIVNDYDFISPIRDRMIKDRTYVPSFSEIQKSATIFDKYRNNLKRSPRMFSMIAEKKGITTDDYIDQMIGYMTDEHSCLVARLYPENGYSDIKGFNFFARAVSVIGTYKREIESQHSINNLHYERLVRRETELANRQLAGAGVE